MTSLTDNSEALVYRKDTNGVASITLNRPHVLNALSPDLFVELRDLITSIKNDVEDIGVVIIRGEGRAFSAGNDLGSIAKGEQAPSKYFQSETIDALENLPQPVIASVKGACYTGALELMLAADLVIASDNAVFCDTHAPFSLTPLWGMTKRLPLRIGTAASKEMMYTGKRVLAEEALKIGLINRVVKDEDLEAETMTWAEQIAANSWHTLREDKRLLNDGLNYTYKEGLVFERTTSLGPGADMGERLAKLGPKAKKKE